MISINWTSMPLIILQQQQATRGHAVFFTALLYQSTMELNFIDLNFTKWKPSPVELK